MEDTSDHVDSKTQMRACVRGYLDGVEAAILDNDFDRYADLMHLPLVIATRNQRFVRTERAHLRQGFNVWRRTVEANTITEIFQSIGKLETFGPDAIMCTYHTDLLSGTTRVMPTFTNWIFLRQSHGIWKLEQMVSGISNTDESHFIQVDPANADPRF